MLEVNGLSIPAALLLPLRLVPAEGSIEAKKFCSPCELSTPAGAEGGTNGSPRARASAWAMSECTLAASILAAITSGLAEAEATMTSTSGPADAAATAESGGEGGTRTGGGAPDIGARTAAQATQAGSECEGLEGCCNFDICLCVIAPINIHTCSHLSLLISAL